MAARRSTAAAAAASAEPPAKMHASKESDVSDISDAEELTIDEKRAINIKRNDRYLESLGLGGTWKQQQQQKASVKKPHSPRKAKDPLPQRTSHGRKAKNGAIKYIQDSEDDDSSADGGRPTRSS